MSYRLHVRRQLEEIDFCSTPLDELIRKLETYKETYKEYSKLAIEDISDWSYSNYVLVGYRDETDEEYNERTLKKDLYNAKQKKKRFLEYEKLKKEFKDQ